MTAPQIVGGNKARSYRVLLDQGSRPRITPTEKETTMKEWLRPEITESEAGMEVTSYLPAELDRS